MGPHGACRDREFLQWDGDFEQLMADSQKKRKSWTPRAAQSRAKERASTAERVSDLAWAGQHAQAIELATTALATSGLSVGSRLDLLDLRPGSRTRSWHRP